MLLKSGIEPSKASLMTKKKCIVNADTVTIGDTVVPRYSSESSAKVPNVLFYELPQVISVEIIFILQYLLKKCTTFVYLVTVLFSIPTC